MISVSRETTIFQYDSVVVVPYESLNHHHSILRIFQHTPWKHNQPTVYVLEFLSFEGPVGDAAWGYASRGKSIKTEAGPANH